MENGKKTFFDWMRKTDSALNEYADLLWLLPSLWLVSSFFDALKVALFLLVALLIRTVLQIAERWLPEGGVPLYRLIGGVALALAMTLAAYGWFPGLVEGKIHLMFLSAFCVGICPVGDREESLSVPGIFLNYLFRGVSFLLCYLLFGLLRELLSSGTVFSGTSRMISLTEKIYYKPLSFFETFPGGLLLMGLIAGARRGISLLLFRERKKPENEVEKAEETEESVESTEEIPAEEEARIPEGGDGA